MKYFKLFIDRFDPVTKKFNGAAIYHFSPDKVDLEIKKNARAGIYTDPSYPEGFSFDYLQVDETTYRFKNWKLNDVIGADVSLNGSTGFALTLKLKTILEQFNLATHRFYEAKLKAKKVFYTYNVVQFLEDSYLEYCDYSKFTFIEVNANYNPIPNSKEYHFNNDAEVSEEQSKLSKNILQLREEAIHPYINLEHMPTYISVKKVVFKLKGAEIDFMRHGRIGWLVSERLAEALIENKITGIKLEELTDIEFVVE